MVGTVEKWLWIATVSALLGFAVPWFLWGDDTVVWGVPVWVWWHVGWLVAASVVFWAFGRRAWGLGVAGDRGGESA